MFVADVQTFGHFSQQGFLVESSLYNSHQSKQGRVSLTYFVTFWFTCNIYLLSLFSHDCFFFKVHKNVQQNINYQKKESRERTKPILKVATKN